MARPAKKWTHAQRRQLVRLYTLTNLSSPEIRDLLEANGLKVSLKTLQNMLHSLFPRDYTKEYSRYRPRNLCHMKARLDLVKKISSGRVSNPRRYLRKESRRQTTRSRPISCMEGIIESPESPNQELSKPKQTQEKPTLSILHNLNLINTGMLMLDGSTMEYNTCANFEPSTHYSRRTPPIIEHPPRFLCQLQNQSATIGKTIDPKALHILISSSESRPSSRQSQQSNGHTSLQPTPLSDSASRRLSEQPPSPVHSWKNVVNSVLRLSLAESQVSGTTGSMPSWRSSDISMYGNSLRSKFSCASVSYQDGRISERPGSPSLSKTPPILTKEELDMWNELIEEDNILPTSRILNRIPKYPMITPRLRECCPPINKLYLECDVCGFSQDHFLAVSGIAAPTTGNLNRRDKFGNNALHYAASSSNATIHQLLCYIELGADIKAVNVLGQTFLHIFNSRRLEAGVCTVDSQSYHSLLEKLAHLNFPFQQKDFHGQTIAHLTFQDWRRFDGSEMCTSDGFQNALQIMGTDMNACDNQGRRVQDRIAPVGPLVGYRDCPVLSDKEIDRIFAEFSDPLNEDLSFRQEITRDEWKPEPWITSLIDSDQISWLDIHGDTPLTAILKFWKTNDDELDLKTHITSLLEAGVEHNMRDRRGHTALAIAALRGSRPCVQVLLQWRAKPNNRNYEGKSIMEQVSSRLRMALKKQRDEVYARLLSCVLLLKDKGAVMHPGHDEEWQLPPRQTGNEDLIDWT
ncbi:hypothetical protein HYFRA_00011688 [Hymenoscyphus fraxineus]|uniref:Ankyrin n=1 Tax=Hymenoscyphus fraxineus TaxID=746836 RepID=A0A9N9PJH2_9HELO|nr:hypothetical protein HYFRA_00011688 [Hymenoscyphus fraxineus]